MTDIFMVKTDGGLFAPCDDESQDHATKFGMGEVIKCTFTKPRNYKFHKKFFAMLNYAFSVWEPPSFELNGQLIQKSRKTFRENIIVLAGYSEIDWNLDGTYTVRAKSISFANMDQGEFEELYSNVSQAVLDNVLVNYTLPGLEHVINQLVRF